MPWRDTMPWRAAIVAALQVLQFACRVKLISPTELAVVTASGWPGHADASALLADHQIRVVPADWS